MPSVTRQEVKFLDSVDDVTAAVILDFINVEDIEEEERESYIESVGNVYGRQLVEQYRQWREQREAHKETSDMPSFMRNIHDETIVEIVTEILTKTDLSEEEKEATLAGCLDENQMNEYRLWKEQTNAEAFLKFLPLGIASMTREKLAKGEFSKVALLVAGYPEAKAAFNEWNGARGGLSAASPPTVPVFKPTKNRLQMKVEVPSSRIRHLPWHNKITRMQTEFSVRLEMRTGPDPLKKEDGGLTTFTVDGVPNSVLDCTIEIFGFTAKAMKRNIYLPEWLAEMVRDKWDRQKRISFMKKTLTDLWITTVNGFDVVKLNGFNDEEVRAAEAILHEEFEKVKKSSSNIQMNVLPSINNADLYPEAMNILLLGESGVGKSTFINSLANYAFNSTFEDAKRGETNILIPFYVEMEDERGRKFQELVEATTKNGNEDNEKLSFTQSATQKSQSYVLEFCSGGVSKKVRIIDTPGVMDTRGAKQDTENMNMILDYLTNFEQLHAILILLKPDEDKLNANLKFSMKKLFTHLHVDASKIINFCFTRGYGVGFRPGATRGSLQKLLDEVIREDRGVDIRLNEETMYTFDNKGFGDLCAIRKGRRMSPREEEKAEESWFHSAQETKRLFKRILSLAPHDINSMLLVNNVREVINCLARPMAQVAREQLTNRRTIREKMEEIENFEGKVEKLRGRLNITQMKMEVIELDQPQTVCTAAKCTTYKKIGEKESPVHNQLCHKNCHLTNVTVGQANNPALKNCAAFSTLGINCCNVCDCDWTTHQHIRYRIEPVETEGIDEEVAGRIQNNEDLKRSAENFLRRLREKDSQFDRDIEKVAKVGAEFAMFVRNKCMMAYNDAYLEFLEKEITEEEERVLYTGCNSVMLMELKNFRHIYVQEVKLLDSQHQHRDVADLDEKGIRRLITEVMDHPSYGSFIRKAHHLEVNGIRSHAAREEKRLQSLTPFTFMIN